MNVYCWNNETYLEPSKLKTVFPDNKHRRIIVVIVKYIDLTIMFQSRLLFDLVNKSLCLFLGGLLCWGAALIY